MPVVHGNVYGGVGVGPVSPMHDSFGIDQGEGEPGDTIEVCGSHHHLARISDGSGKRRDEGNAESEKEQEEDF